MKTTAIAFVTPPTTAALPRFNSRLTQHRHALALRARRCAASLVVALLTILGFAAPVAAGEQVQIKGSVSSGQVEVIPVGPTVLLFHGTGSGQATYLGTLMMEIWLYVDITAPETAYGQYKLTTPSGATLNADFTAVGVPTEEDPSVIHFLETGIITGGTGRFAGATGVITREGLNNEDVAMLGGTISTPGASKK